MLSADVAERVEYADIDYMVARIGALASLPGNPHGAHVRQAGDASAFLVTADPNPMYNNVQGMTVGSAKHLAELGEWYARHGTTFRVDVTPQQATDDLFAALREAGLTHVGFFGGLYAAVNQLAERVADGPSAITVEPADVEEFASRYVAGLSYPAAHVPTMLASVLVLSSVPGIHLFRARFGAHTVGVGLLHVAGRTGYLATASTLVEARGKGVQLALITRRTEVAASLGCDLVVGHAAFGGSSQRNLERAGFRLAYTKALWALM